MTATEIERMVRRVANIFGFDVRRHRPSTSELGRLATMLSTHGVDLVLDVGANTGQFAGGLRKAGYAGRVVSFEPLAAAHAQLLQASAIDPNWEIAPRTAIGDIEGEIEMHVAANSVSSSVLEMLSSHAEAAPGSSYIGTERTPISRLDTLSRVHVQSARATFLKIDTQGFEDRVLDGACETLGMAQGLQIELSFIPLYREQQLFDAMVERLRALGYSIWAIWPGFFNADTGRMLQVDVVFFRD